MRLVLAFLVISAVACGSEDSDGAPSDRASTIADLTGDVTSGEAVYTANCVSCHLADGTGETGGGTGIDLVALLVEEPNGDLDFIGTIIEGEGGMTAFGNSLSDQEIADVMAYVHDAFGG